MKNIFVLIIFNIITLTSYAQDYSKYRIIFYDEFNYPDATDPAEGFKRPIGSGPLSYSGSTFNHEFREFWALENGTWGKHFRCIEDEAKMTTTGMLRLHETKLSSPYLDPFTNEWVHYTAGYLKLKHDSNPAAEYGYGIIEAKVIFPNKIPKFYPGLTHCTDPTKTENEPTAPVSFWNYNGINEIDVFDVSTVEYINMRAFDHTQLFSATSQSQSNTINITPGLANNVPHIFTAVWSPSCVNYYINNRFITSISYQLIRTYARNYDLELAIMPQGCPYPTTTGQYMDIDWVKIWEPKCLQEDLIITGPTGTGSFYDKYGATGRLLRYRSVSINSTSPLTLPHQTLPTVIHSESTTITGNFFADQSTFSTSTVTLNDHETLRTEPHISNAFLEIKAMPCVSENVPIVWQIPDGPPETPSEERQSTGSNDNSKKLSSSSYANNNVSGKSNTDIKGHLSSNGNITIHPNPTTGQLNITMPALGDYDVKITNMLGVVVYQGKLKDERHKQIQLENNLPSGNYTVQITGKEVNHIEKITLTR